MDIQLNESKTAKKEGNNTNWFFSKYTVWVMVCGVSSVGSMVGRICVVMMCFYSGLKECSW